MPLVALVLRLNQKTSHSRQALKNSVRRKWTYQQKHQPGRPPIDTELEQWILRVGLFDTVFESEGIEIVNIPFEAPNANAIAERRARSVREECLDRLIIPNKHHLLGLQSVIGTGPIRYRNVLGGIIRDYYREAA